MIRRGEDIEQPVRGKSPRTAEHAAPQGDSLVAVRAAMGGTPGLNSKAGNADEYQEFSSRTPAHGIQTAPGPSHSRAKERKMADRRFN